MNHLKHNVKYKKVALFEQFGSAWPQPQQLHEYFGSARDQGEFLNKEEEEQIFCFEQFYIFIPTHLMSGFLACWPALKRTQVLDSIPTKGKIILLLLR